MNGTDLLNTKLSYYGNVKYNISKWDVTLKAWLTKYSLKNKPSIDKIRELYDEELLEKNGIKVKTVNISEIMKGKGALHCITAYLKRG